MIPRPISPVATTITTAALLFLTGCGATPPKFQVKDVAVTEQSEEAVVVMFRLEAENRNADPLPLRNVDYSLALQGRLVFRGKRSAEATLRRYGTQEVLLPVSIPIGPDEVLAEPPSGQMPYTFAASFEYELPGTIAEALFDSGVRIPTAGVSESGRLDFAPPVTTAP